MAFLGIRRPKNFKLDFQMYWFFKNWLKVSIAHNTYKTINILETIFFYPTQFEYNIVYFVTFRILI